MRWNRVPVALTACLALMLATPVAQAQSPGQASAADKKFVMTAMKGGLAEVKLGQMASERGSSVEVKQFGQKMVEDHTKLNDNMKPVAAELGITAPTELPAKDKALEKKLQGLSGQAFDKAYMSAMVKDHHKDLTEFKKEAASGENPQVKEQAQAGSDVIAQHLQLADQVAKKVGAGSGRPSKAIKAGSTNPQ